jgi:hypothetical protein
VLDQRKQVLAVREAVVEYEKGKSYVELETAPQRFEKREVVLGISDGVHVEVKSGVKLGDKVKIPETAGPAAPEGSGGPGGPGGGKPGGGSGGKPGGGGSKK